jgi:hypothetical protein
MVSGIVSGPAGQYPSVGFQFRLPGSGHRYFVVRNGMAQKFIAVQACVAVLIVLALCVAGADVSAKGYTVTLHCDRPEPLDPAGIRAIYSWALRLVSSSQSNSAAPTWDFPRSEVEQEYRAALSGDYLRIDLPSLAVVKTMGGVVHVRAVVKNLDPLSPDWRLKYTDHFDDSLFTIDESGAVVGYSLYSGLDIAALNRTIERALTDRRACMRAEGIFMRDSQLPLFIRDFLAQNNLQDLR